MTARGPRTDEVDVTVYRSLAEGRAPWSRAESGGESHLFQSPAWGETWFRTIGAALGVEPRLVRVSYPGGELFLPMALERGRFGVRRLGFLDGGLTDHAAPVTAGDGVLPSSAWPALARRIAAAAGADVVDWRHLTREVGGRPNPLIDARSSHTAYATHRLDIAGPWADFARKRLSTSYRAGGRRRLRRLERAGAPRFVTTRDVDEALALLETTMTMKSARYAATGRPDRLANPAYRAFFREMTREHLGSGLVRLSALLLDEAVLAAHWGCVHRGTFLWLMPAYDEAWAQASPGRLLLDHLVERSFDEGLRVFDFTIGDEPYKATYADRHETLGRSVHARTPLGFAYAVRARREGRPPSA